MFELIKDNYEELLAFYCRFKDKNKIINGSTVEDNFNDKILIYIESGITPNIVSLRIFLKEKRKENRHIKCVELKDIHADIIREKPTIDKLQYLFIDYQKQEKHHDIKKRKKRT